VSAPKGVGRRGVGGAGGFCSGAAAAGPVQGPSGTRVLARPAHAASPAHRLTPPEPAPPRAPPHPFPPPNQAKPSTATSTWTGPRQRSGASWTRSSTRAAKRASSRSSGGHRRAPRPSAAGGGPAAQSWAAASVARRPGRAGPRLQAARAPARLLEGCHLCAAPCKPGNLLPAHGPPADAPRGSSRTPFRGSQGRRAGGGGGPCGAFGDAPRAAGRRAQR
jgi:hypothetical protein